MRQPFGNMSPAPRFEASVRVRHLLRFAICVVCLGLAVGLATGCASEETVLPAVRPGPPLACARWKPGTYQFIYLADLQREDVTFYADGRVKGGTHVLMFDVPAPYDHWRDGSEAGRPVLVLASASPATSVELFWVQQDGKLYLSEKPDSAKQPRYLAVPKK